MKKMTNIKALTKTNRKNTSNTQKKLIKVYKIALITVAAEQSGDFYKNIYPYQTTRMNISEEKQSRRLVRKYMRISKIL